MRWYVIPLFTIMLILSIYSAIAATSAGLPVVLEWKNHTMVSGLHNLTVVVSNNFTCSNQIVANQTFIGGIVNGRSNITLRNLTVDYNTNYYVCKYLDGAAVGGSPMNTTLGQGYIQLRDLNVSGLNNAIAPVWGNVSGKPVDLINSTFANNTYIFKVNESFLSVNNSLWWANISGFQYRWFITLNNQLFLNETTLNSTVDTRIDLKLSPVQTNITEINNTINSRIDTKLSLIQTNMTEINNTLNTRVTTLENRPISNASASGVATKLALFNNATHLVASDISEDSTQINFTKNVYVRNNLTVNGTFIASIDATNITSGTVSILRLPNLNNSHFHDAKNLTGVLQVANGGTGLSTLPALRLLWTTATDVLNTTSLSSMLSVSNGVLFVENATSTQKIDVFRNNTFIGTSESLNFIAGANVSINVTYDSELEQNNITISSFGGGGTADGVGGNATAGGIADRLARFTNSTHLSWTNITVNSTSFIARLLNYQLYFGGDSSPSIDIKQSGFDNYFLIDSHFEVDDAADVIFTANATKISGFNNQFEINSTGIISKGNISCGQIIGGSDTDYCADASGGGGGGNATSAGTANYIAKFTNQTNLGNSVAYDNGSNIGIGLITPNEKLTLNGSLSFTDSDYAPAATSGFGKLYSTGGGVDSFTRLNLHFDGTDGSTTFSDSSSYNKLMVANGNVQIDTAQSKFGGASGLFDGTGDYLKSTDVPTDFDFGSGNFTIDAWVYLDEAMGIASRMIASRGGGTDGWDSSGGHHWNLFTHTDSKLYFQWYTGGGTGSIISTNTVSVNSAWHHIAVVKNGSMTTIYVDGGRVGNASVGTISEPTGGTQALTIGSVASGNNGWHGWIDELRISKGVIRWGSNFTVPSSAYSVPGLNYIDNTGAITSISGTVPITRGGTGLTTVPVSRLLWSSALDTFTTLSLGNGLINASGTILSVVNNSNIQKVNVLNNGAAVGTRSSVNFIPGNQVSLTISDNSGSDRVDVTINSTATSGGDATAVNKSNYVYGVASNLKVTNANPDEYTKYLLHFEGVNASTVFSDSSLYMQGVTPTGTVAVTNDTQKFGSVGHFNGASNSYLALTSVGDWEWGNFGTKNFTFDFWLNFKQLPADSTGQYIWIYYQVAVEERSITVKNVSGVYTLNYKNNDDTWSGNLTGLTSGTWHHYAIVRNSTSLNIFFDGGMVSSRAITTNSPLRTATPQIGTFNSGSYLFNGYMDEFRFSLGSARWNSNFTSPASEYYGYPQYRLNISADVINLYDGENATTVKNVGVTPNINVTGVNGLDAGFEANSVWYYAWVINNGATTAGLLSTSSTSPTMPAGYSFKKLVSAVYNNAGGNFSGFQHIDGDYTYLYPVKIINDGGSTTTTAIDLSTTVPKRELTKGVFGKMLTNGAFALNMNPVQFRNNIASDNSVTEFAIYNGYNGPPGPSQWSIRSLIEEQTIYYQLDANTLDMWVSGFTTRG